MLAHGSIEYVPKKKLVIHSLLHHLYLLLALEMWRKGKFDIKTTEWDFGEFCWYPGFSHLVGIFFSHVGLVPSFINKRFRLNDSRNNYPEKPSSSSNFAIVACQAPLSMAFPGKNTGVGFHFLFQGILLTQRSNPRLPHWQGVLYHWATREATNANSQLSLCILVAASGATVTLISKTSSLLGIPEGRGEVVPNLVQIASHWNVL